MIIFCDKIELLENVCKKSYKLETATYLTFYRSTFPIGNFKLKFLLKFKFHQYWPEENSDKCKKHHNANKNYIKMYK